MIDRTVAQHAGPAEDLVRRARRGRRAARSTRSSVGPKIAVTGTPSAAARCIAPESFETNAAHAARTPASARRSVRPIRFDDARIRPAATILSHARRRGRRRRRPARSVAPRSSTQPRDHLRRRAPAASAWRARTPRPARTRRCGAPAIDAVLRRAAPRPRARRVRRDGHARRAASGDVEAEAAHEVRVVRRLVHPRRAAAARARVSSQPRRSARIAPALAGCPPAARSTPMRNEFGSSTIASKLPGRAAAARSRLASSIVRTRPARPSVCSSKSGATDGKRRDRERASGQRRAHRRHRRQRHHGVAEPVRRADDEP